MKFAHLEYDTTVFDWQGSQIPWIGFDEITHFTEKQFVYMGSRNRSTSGIPGRIRATCNPDVDSWVRKYIDFWIDSDGYPIAERSGVVRWFIRKDDTMYWGDSRQELIEAHGADELPKSFTFIPSKIHDNKILLAKDPTYLSNLKALSRVDRLRLLEGNWNVRATAGLLFRREWFPIVEVVPGGWIQSIRFWDRACLIADTKITTIDGEKEIQDIKVGDLVLTRKGFKKVTWSGMSKTTNEIISVVFSNGAVISGTSCHPTYTLNRGWVKLSELTGSDRVLCKNKLLTGRDTSNSTVDDITSTTKNTSITMSGTESGENIFSGCCIETYGNSTMDPFPMVIISTTKTGTDLTTKLKILNVSQERPTHKHIKVISQSKLISKIRTTVKKHMKLFQRGPKNSKNIDVKHVKTYSSPKVLRRNIAACDALKLKNIIAKNAVSFSTQEKLRRNIVVSHAPIKGVPVYDLTVEDAHEFFAEGILVHNSTKPNEVNKDPDWTRGLLVYKYMDGTFCVVDLKSLRDTPGQVEKLVKNVAAHDSFNVTIISQQDPGSAGVSEADNFVRMLVGYDVRTQVLSKDKITRAKPASAQAEAGNIKVLRAPWNDEFFSELEGFPDINHDDIVDTLSGCINSMAGGLSIVDAMWRG